VSTRLDGNVLGQLSHTASPRWTKGAELGIPAGAAMSAVEKPRAKSHRLILPLGMRVLVSVIREEDRTGTGLYLPEGAKEQHNEALYGEVIEVARTKQTSEAPAENVSGVPYGSKVLFKKEAGVKVPWNDNLRLLDVQDILATVEEHSAEDAH